MAVVSVSRRTRNVAEEGRARAPAQETNLGGMGTRKVAGEEQEREAALLEARLLYGDAVECVKVRETNSLIRRAYEGRFVLYGAM